MAELTLKKLVLAQQQLETAIGLFVSRKDRISAISLAGAADGILHGLVLKAGKKPFADYAMGVREALSGETPAKAKFAKHILRGAINSAGITRRRTAHVCRGRSGERYAAGVGGGADECERYGQVRCGYVGDGGRHTL